MLLGHLHIIHSPSVFFQIWFIEYFVQIFKYSMHFFVHRKRCLKHPVRWWTEYSEIIVKLFKILPQYNKTIPLTVHKDVSIAQNVARRPVAHLKRYHRLSPSN